MGSARTKLVIKVLSGFDDPERTMQAFTVAAAAIAAGVDVSLWLTSDASEFALPGNAEKLTLPYAAPLDGLLQTILDNGTVTLCTQCAQRRGITAEQLLPGVVIKGAASFVEEIMGEGVQALVY
jgi:predicted peroxiredoxin